MSLFVIVALPFLGALLPGVMIGAGRRVCALATLLVTLTAFAGLLAHVPAIMSGEVLQARADWLPVVGLNATFFLDGLGLLFAGLILGIGTLIIIYARYYLAAGDSMGQFYTYLLLFQGAMVGIVLSDNILMLLVFWELTSLSSFLLIGYWKHLPEGRQGARMALAVTGMGGLAMIAGMLLVGEAAGSYDLTVILENREAIQASPYYVPALILILLGCFTKSAQFPFHFWLPHAMAAPTPVSAYLHSATMVKAGLFLMARMWPVLAGTDIWFYIVATTGLVTMVVAAVIALFKDDLKALLAYSTVSHLGLITMLLGFGTPFAAVTAVFHIINHATFKAALFMTAGIVDHEAHTRDIRRLGGLRRLMPITFAIALVASLSMAGIPLFNGFLSKEMMLEEASHTVWAGLPWLLPVAVTLGSLFSAAYSFRFLVHTFFGPVRDDYPHKPHDPGFGMWGPPALLAVLVLLIGVLPALIAGPLVALTSEAVIRDELPYYSLALWHGITPALFMSIIAVVGGALALAAFGVLDRVWQAAPVPVAKRMFDRTIGGAVGASRRLIGNSHDGALTRYAAIFMIVVVAAGAHAYFTGTIGASTRTMLPAGLLPVLTWLLLLVGTGALVLYHRQRLLALVLLGILGLVVSVAFNALSAPDLALTQFSVEVVTIILLLLALNFLPKRSPDESTPARRWRDGAIGCVAGLGAGWLAYAILMRDFAAQSISDFHLANSYKGGGGTNVVNVILVDFRGFDTFGEIIVLGIAAMVIFAAVESLLTGPVREKLLHWIPDQRRAGDRHPLMMVVATRVMMPVVLVVGFYIFLRGHNEPGGGFISGLIVAIAFLMQYMASGFEWATARQRFPYHGIVGAGVLIAGLTGIGSWVFGVPFLASAFGYVRIPPFNEFELATAMLFDLGVFLTVVGAVLLSLASFSRMARTEDARSDPYPMDIDPSREEA